MAELSILIPARNEEFLARTIEDILSNIEVDTEVIVTLDGQWADPPVVDNDRVNLIYVSQSVGQRAATDLACKLSKAKYVMKVDAHCAFDKGFDRKMIEAFEKTGDNVTMLPIMRNLWIFDWKCYHCGKRWYQDNKPDKCDSCGKADKIRRKMLWFAKPNPRSTSYCFDSEPKFGYFEDYKHRPEYEKDKKEKGLTQSMSIQGSCFMTTREKYWELDLGGEKLGNWGGQGIQIACATWLSGGEVLVNHNTWYAHLFRTKAKFGFPWSASGRDQQRVKKNVRDLFWVKGHPKQIRPVSWLIDKFYPVPGWSDEDIKNLKETEFKP